MRRSLSDLTYIELKNAKLEDVLPKVVCLRFDLISFMKSVGAL